MCYKINTIHQSYPSLRKHTLGGNMPNTNKQPSPGRGHGTWQPANHRAELGPRDLEISQSESSTAAT